MPQDREPYLVDATPQLRAVILMVQQGWHPNDIQVALRRSRGWVRYMRERANEFLDHRPQDD